jgi:hypothetical protein
MKPCPYGRKLLLLEKLGGRIVETIQLLDGRKFNVDVLEINFKDELKSWFLAQLNQMVPNRLLWRIGPFLSIDPEAPGHQILKKSNSISKDIEVEVEFIEGISRTPAAKLPRIIPFEVGT